MLDARCRTTARPGPADSIKLPETDLAGVAEQPAVADDAVLGRRFAGEDSCLSGAGDRRKRRTQQPPLPEIDEGAKARGEFQQTRRQTNGIDENEGHESGNNLGNDVPMHIGQPAVDAVVAEGQLRVVEAE